MTLLELITIVKDQDLSKEQLEDYYADLSILLAQLHNELGDREKERALFIDSCTEKTEAKKVIKWQVSDGGQREIVLKRYLKSAEHLQSGIKQRIYSKL